MSSDRDVYRRVVEIRKESIPTELIFELKKYHGVGEYNIITNMQCGSGMLYRGLVDKYGLDLVHAAEQLCVLPLKKGH